MSFHIKIGNYRFSKNLGTGSFGKVKLAFNEVTGHKVAIKILNKKKIKQQGVFEKVKREIKVLRLFNHPHIIKHYEFIDTPSDIFMVIEYASGGELFDLISRRERLEENEARRFFQQIYSSIEYTHIHKIAHRDLKPENLLLDENNNIKLIDFGLANSMKDSQALKTACGSPNYAAPEVISGRSYGGVEVDVWSLGVILFAMVCGSLPFDDDSMSMLFNKIKEGKYYMPNYISTDVKDLINRMLQPNPVKRITMKEIKEHPWYLQDLPMYLQDLSQMHVKKQQEVDLEIVKKIFTLPVNLQGKSQEEVIKAIKEKKNTDFCGIYELYYHDKLKKDCFQIQHQEDQMSFPKERMHFKTLKHLCMQHLCPSNPNQDNHPLITASQLPQHYQQHFLLSQSSQQNLYQQHQPFTLLSSKHDDRLSRIMSKLRLGQVTQGKKNGLSGSSTQSSEEHAIRSSRINSMVSTQIETVKAGASGGGGGVLQTQNFTVLDEGPLFTKMIQNHALVKQQWTFGVKFIGSATDMLNLICEILKLLEIEWQLIPKDLKMKCRSRIDENSLSEYESLIKEENMKDDMIKEFLRKNFVKFYINIFKDQSKSTSEERYQLDIHLFKGTIYVFMDFVKRFLTELQLSCTIISPSQASSAIQTPLKQGARSVYNEGGNGNPPSSVKSHDQQSEAIMGGDISTSSRIRYNNIRLIL